jgi:toxin YoeB
MNKIIFEPQALEHLTKWAKENPKILKRIVELIDNINKTPFEGLGKPEALKHQYKGSWSRRITDEHRLIYQVLNNGDIRIISVHGHYV